MNWAQLKNLVSHMCLAGTVVASCFLTQKVACSSPFTVMTNMFFTECAEFSENIEGKLYYGAFTVTLFIGVFQEKTPLI